MTLATRIAVTRWLHRHSAAAPTKIGAETCSLRASSVRRRWSSHARTSDNRAVQVGTAEVPLNGYRFCSSPTAGQDVAARTARNTLRSRATGQNAIDAEALFMELWGAYRLGGFQFGEHRLSVRLVPQMARGTVGKRGPPVIVRSIQWASAGGSPVAVAIRRTLGTFVDHAANLIEQENGSGSPDNDSVSRWIGNLGLFFDGVCGRNWGARNCLAAICWHGGAGAQSPARINFHHSGRAASETSNAAAQLTWKERLGEKWKK